MPILLNISAIVLVVATLLPLSQRRVWWIRAMDFPRLQLSVLCLVWLAIFLYSSGLYSSGNFGNTTTVLAVVVALIVGYQLYWILPYTEINAVEVDTYHQTGTTQPNTISVLSCNVLMDNRTSQPLLEQLDSWRPDIFIMLESDQWWQDEIEKATDFPHHLRCPLDNYYGMHVYSHLQLHKASIDYLVEPDKPSMRFQIILNDNSIVQLHVMHPAPPSPTENSESTERDVELISLARTLADSGNDKPLPTIVAGDLNDVAWSATTRLFRQISGLLDPRIGRGTYNTFNAFHWWIRWPLDHVFVSPHFTLLALKRLPAVASDHFPLYVKLALQSNSEPTNQLADTPVDETLEEQILSSEVARQADKPTTG